PPPGISGRDRAAARPAPSNGATSEMAVLSPLGNEAIDVSAEACGSRLVEALCRLNFDGDFDGVGDLVEEPVEAALSPVRFCAANRRRASLARHARTFG